MTDLDVLKLDIRTRQQLFQGVQERKHLEGSPQLLQNRHPILVAFVGSGLGLGRRRHHALQSKERAHPR